MKIKLSLIDRHKKVSELESQEMDRILSRGEQMSAYSAVEEALFKIVAEPLLYLRKALAREAEAREAEAREARGNEEEVK